MKKYKVGIVGGTGMVGQRYVLLISEHPWFELTLVAASTRSAGKTYENAVSDRWAMEKPIPDCAKKLIVKDALTDMAEIAAEVDFIFSAVDMKKDEIREMENAYAKLECPVVSNNSAHRWTPDVPMVIPELNNEHIKVIENQRKRLGVKRGFIAAKSNCSIQSYVPALHPLREEFGIKAVLACTYQAISGAGKTFERWPEMLDNCIPYLGGEEEKSEREPMKIWGKVENGVIIEAEKPAITAQCLRVACSDGHMAAVFVSFDKKPTREEILDRWANFKGRAQELNLPTAPKQFLHYFSENDRPQTKLDRNLENGMALSVGRLREDTQYDYKFVCLSHNTLRGAAGGAVELAELLCAEGYIEATH
ncbi:MAG: aspartate-semialdehyde dehydrogenase [Oscillospiraceae bacterium]